MARMEIKVFRQMETVTVVDYQSQFQKLRCKLRDLPALLDMFVGGLRKDICVDVKAQKPRP